MEIMWVFFIYKNKFQYTRILYYADLQKVLCAIRDVKRFVNPTTEDVYFDFRHRTGGCKQGKQPRTSVFVVCCRLSIKYSSFFR